MPWSVTWSGLPALVASSVSVIGSTTELDLQLLNTANPPIAAIIFKDKTGNNANPAIIFSQRDAATNGMIIELVSQDVAQLATGEIIIKPGDVQITALGAGGGTQVATLELNGTAGQILTGGVMIVSGEVWTAPTLLNGWTNLGTPYQTAAFRKMPDGNVQLRGVVANGTKTDGTVMFTLPAGYAPTKDEIVEAGNASATGLTPTLRIRAATGNVEIWQMSTSTSGAHSWTNVAFSTIA